MPPCHSDGTVEKPAFLLNRAGSKKKKKITHSWEVVTTNWPLCRYTSAYTGSLGVLGHLRPCSWLKVVFFPGDLAEESKNISGGRPFILDLGHSLQIISQCAGNSKQAHKEIRQHKWEPAAYPHPHHPKNIGIGHKHFKCYNYQAQILKQLFPGLKK